MVIADFEGKHIRARSNPAAACTLPVMGAIISLLIIVAVSLIAVRIGTIALVMTGLPWDVASFQAYSAFFGVGFTTREAEMVVSDQVRRRVIKHLILGGNIGLTAAVGSVIVAFVKADGPIAELWVLLWIVVGVAALVLLSLSGPVRRTIDWIIKRSMRHAGVLHPADFALLLHIHAGYVVEEVEVHATSHLVGHTLRESRLGSRGVVVLGCTRHAPAAAGGAEVYHGAPGGDFTIESGDVLTVYGREQLIPEVMK